MANKLTGMNWLKEWIKKLEITNSDFKEKIEILSKMKPEVYNEFREWTPLKLILLNYALDVCTSIIKNHKYLFKEMYYVDLFAGSGINKIRGSEDFLIGSPLIATLNYSDDYTSMIFCEKKKIFVKALSLRLESLNKSNLSVKGEYEFCLNEIINNVNNRGVYSFFFIDPCCMEFNWESMKKVLNVRSDIIFTFMSSEIYRAVGLAKSGIGVGGGLAEMFGGDSWKNANSVEELVEIYKKNILREREDAPIRIIQIRSEQFNFCYHLFFITNRTKQDNKWLRAIDKAKEEIESNSDLVVIKALDIVKKRQTTLEDF